MNPLSKINAGLIALIALQGDGFSFKREKPPIPVRPCLYCGKPKQHNNSFCSWQCCQAFRLAKEPL